MFLWTLNDEKEDPDLSSGGTRGGWPKNLIPIQNAR